MADTEKKKDKKSELALREEAVLDFWNKEHIFEKSLKKDAPKGEFVFYDGPPFATGLPHHGHILAGTIKDTIPRYRTMQGYRVRRRWGWDCHGLPLENQIEAKLNIKTKREIEELGVETFNNAAREAVLEYADDWKQIIPRLGRWVDMEDDYRTMDSTYTESVWWSFKALYDKGLVFESFKSMHLCPRCGTTLSNFEVNQGYKDIKDIAVTVKLELVDEPGTSLLAWTTTPWTLPGNMAVAVHEDYDYVKVRAVPLLPQSDTKIETVILAKNILEKYKTVSSSDGLARYEFGDRLITVLEDMKGKALVGKSYKPPFNYYSPGKIASLGTIQGDFKHAWKIFHAPYVTLEDGTGIVHIAPAYGEEDMALAKDKGVPIVHHVADDGRFMAFVHDFAGTPVKPKDDEATGVSHLEADIGIVKLLAQKGLLFKKENITHSYPHCWRCDTPLLNYATNSWFVRATQIRDELVAANDTVKWVPEHIGRARFGNWLENVRDWSVSRQRYWGAPIPVWRNTHTGAVRIIGSLADVQSHTRESTNTYFLMRHGESESNVTGMSSTKRDAKNPLTEKGAIQVRQRAAELMGKNIEVIIASPFERTRMTAESVADVLGISRDMIVYDDRLGEVQMGEYDGSTMVEYHKLIGVGVDWALRKPKGGESWNEVKQRAGEVLFEYEKKYAGKNILIVAHNSPLRMIMAAAHGSDLSEAFDHDEDGKRFNNAEMRVLHVPALPRNRAHELDFHRPFIDEIELFDADGTKLIRVPDVFDCWYESGSMAYAEVHYPFEHADEFKPSEGKGFPADFIAEGVDQTRGWFYSQLVLGVGLFGMSPYKNVIVSGLVLAEDGKKMSKKLKNYPDPLEVVDAYGADTLRFYLLSSPIIKGEDLNFTEQNVAELSRKNIGRLENVLTFYELYKDSAPHDATIEGSPSILDKWIHARLHELIGEVTAGYEGYELDRATKPVTDFIDDLSTWYTRRSRDRFKSADMEDRAHALGAMRYVLRKLSKVIAPVMPFYADYLFMRVRTETDPESVHLSDWPMSGGVDLELIATMSYVRSYATKGLMLRTQKNMKVRQPLALFTITHPGVSPRYWDACASILKDELNVEAVVLEIVEEGEPSADFDWVITEDLKRKGEVRDFIRSIQELRKVSEFTPNDRIVLRVVTDEYGQGLLTEFKVLISETVQANDIVFETTATGTPIALLNVGFSVHLDKVT